MISFLPLLVPISIAIIVACLLHAHLSNYWVASSLTACVTGILWLSIVIAILVFLGDTHEIRPAMVVPVFCLSTLMGFLLAAIVGFVFRLNRTYGLTTPTSP